MDPLTILGVVKSSLAAGRTVASLSKEIGQFFDATDAAKKKLQKKVLLAQTLIVLPSTDGQKSARLHRPKNSFASG